MQPGVNDLDTGELSSQTGIEVGGINYYYHRARFGFLRGSLLVTKADPKLLSLADLNMAEFLREHARWLPPTRIDERDGVLRASCGTRIAAGFFNTTMNTGAGPGDASAFLAGACRHFAVLERGFSLYTRAHLDSPIGVACERAGYLNAGAMPGMALSERLASPDLPTGVELRTVCNPENSHYFIDVIALAYDSIGMPAEVTRQVFSRPERWLTPYVHVEVLLEQGRPVSGAMLLFSHGIAGVYWVGTVPDARGRGYAERLMRSISNRAFDSGAGAVVLQASPFGEPIYRKLGFREITRYPWYLVTEKQVKSATR
jgi:GNAT superfamily N-acetyltransferase